MRYFFIPVLFLFAFLFFCDFSQAQISTPMAISTLYSSGNAHNARGESHIVSVGDTTIAIVSDGGSERLFRSPDHSSWTEILYTASVHGSSLLTGPDNYVYYFYLDSTYDRIRMRKFLADAVSIPAAVNIFTDPDISVTGTGLYRSLSSTIDKDGRIFVFVHYGNPDKIYCLVSGDGGATWNNYLAASDTLSVYGMTATTLGDGTVNLAYDVWGTDMNIWFKKSGDHGATWSDPVLVNNNMSNPAILAVGANTLYVFGQTSGSANIGVIFNRSNDGGTTWQSAVRVEQTCGYGDPGPALGSNGSRIWLTFRSSLNTGVTAGTCGDQSKQVLAYSDDGGSAWTMPWRFYSAERVGTKGHINYQPYYNYGGRIEWLWLQYTDSGAYLRTYYANTIDDTKYTGTTLDIIPPAAPTGLSIS